MSNFPTHIRIDRTFLKSNKQAQFLNDEETFPTYQKYKKKFPQFLHVGLSCVQDVCAQRKHVFQWEWTHRKCHSREKITPQSQFRTPANIFTLSGHIDCKFFKQVPRFICSYQTPNTLWIAIKYDCFWMAISRKRRHYEGMIFWLPASLLYLSMFPLLVMLADCFISTSNLKR